MDKIISRICQVSRSVKFNESKAWWVIRKKWREKLRKILPFGVKEKLPTEVGEICPGTDGVENKWKK